MGLEALTPVQQAARNARLLAGVLVSAWLLGGCAGLFPQTAAMRDAPPPDIPPLVELKDVPFFPQDEYQCGPAALATTLVASGVKVTPEELVPQVYLPERKGSLQVEMLAAARRHGRISYLLAPKFEDLLKEIAAGNPVIVLWDQSPVGSWHYAVAIGYDFDAGDLYLRSGETQREKVAFPVHEFMWRRSGYWAMVALPPERIPATAEEGRWLSAIAATERAGGAQAARTAYERFLNRWPRNPAAAIGLANANYSLGQLPAAERALRDAVEWDPQSVIALNNLAQTLADQGKHEEALRFIERAIALGGPHAAAVEQTRSSILAKQKQRQ
ncbi:MAG TPA: PA2778 family cysteine peptidase [Burkholderiales bacterium]|nr:PA2778 family cysteine peptidase [Burkholderiales bacterium]